MDTSISSRLPSIDVSPSGTAPITAILFAYNQETLVAEAAWSILNQTMVPAEVILSDDCSTDNTYQVLLQVAREYKGPARLKVRRNTFNFRAAKHVNLAVKEASYDWISPHAGDDVCEPGRLKTLLEYQAQHPDVFFFWSAVWPMTWDGKTGSEPHPDIPLSLGHSCMRAAGMGNKPIPDVPDSEQNDLRFIPYGVGPSQFWHKNLFEFFGPLPTYVVGEDAILPFRARCLGKVFFIPEPLIRWRDKNPAIGKDKDKDKDYLFNFRDFYLYCSAARCQARDLGFFLKKVPNAPASLHNLHRRLLLIQQEEQKKFNLAHWERKRFASFLPRLHFFIQTLFLFGPTRQTRNYLITHVLRAPASLEDKIGRRKARLGALLFAMVAAGAAFLGIRQLLGLPIAATTAALMLICAYPAAILIIRTAIRLCTSTTPSP